MSSIDEFHRRAEKTLKALTPMGAAMRNYHALDPTNLSSWAIADQAFRKQLTPMVELAERWARQAESMLIRPELMNPPVPDPLSFRRPLSLLPLSIQDFHMSARGMLSAFSWAVDGATILHKLESVQLLSDLAHQERWQRIITRDLTKCATVLEDHLTRLQTSELARIPLRTISVPCQEHVANVSLVGACVLSDDDERYLARELLRDLSAERAADCDVRDLLGEYGHDLVEIWDGAHAALHSSRPDRARHCATSLRELIAKLLRALAPDDRVNAWLRSENRQRALDRDHKGPTRNERIEYLLQRSGQSSLARFLRQDVKTLTALMDVLSAAVHGEPDQLDDQQLQLLVMRTRVYIASLFELRDPDVHR